MMLAEKARLNNKRQVMIDLADALRAWAEMKNEEHGIHPVKNVERTFRGNEHPELLDAIELLTEAISDYETQCKADRIPLDGEEILCALFLEDL